VVWANASLRRLIGHDVLDAIMYILEGKRSPDPCELEEYRAMLRSWKGERVCCVFCRYNCRWTFTSIHLYLQIAFGAPI
jgi:hypothetical protein